jgi:hypothetical protein
VKTHKRKQTGPNHEFGYKEHNTHKNVGGAGLKPAPYVVAFVFLVVKLRH